MEIFQNTLIKLVVRQGSDSDRKRVLLTSGEPAYTTDTRRFFVGNGVLSGGDLVGNLYQGDFTGGDPSTVEPAEIGDLAYDTDSRKLYRLKYLNTGFLSSWSQIGGVYISGDSKIVISSDNEVTLAALSANSLDADVVQAPIIMNAGKIGLSATIPFTTVSTNTVTVSGGLLAYANSVNVTGVAVNTLSSNLLITSNQLFAKYNGLSGSSIEYARGVTVNRLSAGDYVFNYGPLSTPNVIPVCNIYGIDFLPFQARVMTANISATNVHILSSYGAKFDANVYFSLTY
jgi:hypothetical protein